ncbi:MAG: carboxypeptidase regulatory-like domain-containing protein [Myxococcota bacterium]
MSRGSTRRPGLAGSAAGLLAAALVFWGARAPSPRPAPASAPRSEAPLPPAPPGARTVRGVVLGVGGAPLAGARVEAWSVGVDEGPAASAETGADGGYVLRGIAPRPHRLVARAAGHAPAMAPLGEGLDRAPPLALAPGALLAGQVLQGDGAPAANVELTLVGSGLWPAETLRTDADGRFLRPDVPPGVYALRARRDERVVVRTGIVVRAGTPTELSLRLGPGARLEGVLVDERGEAIAGAELSLAEGGLSPLPRRVVTDDAGRFVASGLLPGSQRVQVRAAGHVPLMEVLTLQAGEIRELVLVASRGAEVAGVVRDARDRPVAGARVRWAGAEPLLELGPEPVGALGVTAEVPPLPLFGVVASESWAAIAGARDAGAETRTDAAGRFVLEGLPPGPGEVIAEAPGYAPAIGPGRRLRAAERVGDVALVLSRGGEVSGRVLDAAGFPADGVLLELRAEREPRPRTRSANDDGTFTFTGVLGRTTITARAAALPPARERVLVAEGERLELELRLPDALASLAGRVLDAEGDPVGLAHVALEAEDPRTPARRTGVSEADGTFAFDGLPGAPWRVRVEARGFLAEERRVTEADDALVVRLARPVALRIAVRDAWSGDAPRTGRVVLRGDEGSPESLPLGEGTAEGPLTRVRSTTLRAGARYVIEVEAPRRQPVDAVVVAGDVDEVLLTLEAAGVVEGSVVDVLGAVVEGARVVGPGELSTTTDANGAFRLEGLAPGQISLEAEAGELRAASGPLRVDPEGLTPGVRIALPERVAPVEDADAETEIVSGVAIAVETDDAGVRVRAVVPGSQAARRGVRSGDRLLQVDGEPVVVAAQARSLLRGAPGTEVALQIARRGRALRRVVRRERHAVP